jgi:hypothetical protein
VASYCQTIEALVAEALHRRLDEADYDFDVTPALIGTPQGPTAVVQVFFWGPAAIIGQRSSNVVNLLDPWAQTTETMTKVVTSAIDQMRAARMSQLAQGNGG